MVFSKFPPLCRPRCCRECIACTCLQLNRSVPLNNVLTTSSHVNHVLIMALQSCTCAAGNVSRSYAPPSMSDSAATVQCVCSYRNVRCSQVVQWWMTSCPPLMKTRTHCCNHIYENKWKSITFCSHHQNNQCLPRTFGLRIIKPGLLLQVTGRRVRANKNKTCIRRWCRLNSSRR